MTVLPCSNRRQVFLEDRADLRLTLDSAGRRDARVTTSRGVAFGEQSTTHITDPTPQEVSEAFGASFVPLVAPPPEFGLAWIEEREQWLRSAAHRVTGAAGGVTWSATLIAFNQSIWVVPADASNPCRDLREGCRYEIVVEAGGHPNARAVAEWAEREGETGSLDHIFERALERATRKRGRLVRGPGGTTAAVFAPGVAGIVAHELVGHALEGDVVAQCPTWIQQTGLGSPARSLSVIDDPRRGRGAWSIDDEGTPPRKTVLIEAGRPVGVLLDARSGERMAAPSTGHGRRASYLDAVRPRMGCTYVADGPDDPAEILRETPSGVFIRRMTAGHTDPIEGRASFLVTEADAIVCGELHAPLEPFVLELDARSAWPTVDRIGHDLAFDTCVGSCVRDGQALAVSVGAPTIRIGVSTVIS